MQKQVNTTVEASGISEIVEAAVEAGLATTETKMTTLQAIEHVVGTGHVTQHVPCGKVALLVKDGKWVVSYPYMAMAEVTMVSTLPADEPTEEKAND